MLVPDLCRRARNLLFCFGKVHSLLENLILQSLAAQSTFNLFDTPHGLLQLGRGDHGFIGTYCHQGAFQIRLAQLEQLCRSQPMLSCNVRHGASRPIGLLDDFKLLYRCSAAVALSTSTRVGRIEDIVISTVGFLVASLRNTGGTVIQGANSS